MASAQSLWRPTSILAQLESFPTGSEVLRVETDQGEGFLKAMGAGNGPHVLACELVGTLLACWIQLRTLDFALIDVPGDLDLRFANGKPVTAGRGFITRAEEGDPWSGEPRELEELDNPQDINRLVVFDTWTMNCDRYRPPNGASLRENKNNVFRSEEGASKGHFALKAIDHGCCFTCENDLTAPQLQRTEHDTRLYGLFPAFRPFVRRDELLQAVEKAEDIPRSLVEYIISQVPSAWQVDASARSAWCDWICSRAKTVRRIIELEWPPTDLLDLLPPEGQTP